MFGRSGQMFPRRTFHDAIYEEEYGSDNEDECCRCRGLSAILCWFLSVIILVGLAATVVITVFFILRSRTMIVKPEGELDVEMYGKDQNLFDTGGATSKELIGSNESSPSSTAGGESGLSKGKKSKRPPDATKNDVDADVNEEQNAINDSEENTDQAENASVNHPHNHHPNSVGNNRQTKLQPYTTSTTEAPATEEEQEETSEETENEQNDTKGSSLFNLFSGPKNPSYNTPHDPHDEFASKELRHHGHQHGVNSAESSETRYKDDGTPVQQVLFTESPKVTGTTPNPYNNRKNLQTTRFPTGRTSFSSTSTTTAVPPEESGEEGEGTHHNGDNDEDEEDHNNEENNDEEEEDDGGVVTNNDDESSHEDEDGNQEENRADHEEVDNHHENDGNHNEKSSEEEEAVVEQKQGSRSTTTSAYDPNSTEKESEMGSQSGESQLKQMLLDSIPPHDKDEGKDGSDEATSSEFNLSQKGTLTTTVKPTTTGKPTKPSKANNPTLSRIISRNFTRSGASPTTTEINTDTTESSTSTPITTTLGPAGHKYDYTMTPYERTKLKGKSAESAEQSTEDSVTKPPPKFIRYRSTTPRSTVVVTPEPTSVPASRTRGTTPPSNSAEFGVKLGGKRGSVESPIDIVPSPDLSPKGQLASQHNQNSAEGVDLTSSGSSEQDTSKNSEQFIDVLVASEVGPKTLVTKKTEDGIVTSAILPPWFDNGSNSSAILDVLSTNGTVPSNVVAKVKDSTSAEIKFVKKTRTKVRSSEERITAGSQLQPVKDEGSKEENASEFDRLVNILSNNKDVSSEEAPPSRFGYKKPKPIVLKKPGGLLSPASRYIPQVPGRASLFPSKSLTSMESSKQGDSGENKSLPATPSASPEEQQAAATTKVEDGDIGRAGEPSDVADAVQNGYYPDDNTNSDRVVEHHLIESERLSSDEIDSVEASPSHVIDVNFDDTDSEHPTEIVIEQDGSAPAEDEGYAEDDYGYGDDSPSMAASAPTNQVVPAPADFPRGSGVRKPMSSEEVEGDTVPSASETQNTNATAAEEHVATTVSPSVISTASPAAAIRRPAYTREEIAKSSVKPSPEAFSNDNNGENNLETPGGSVEMEGSEEYEEYEDDNYEGGSVEQPAAAPVQHWSSEKISEQKWSEPDKMIDNAGPSGPTDVKQNFASLEQEENESAESIPNVNVQNNNLENQAHAETESVENSTRVFTPPQLVSFHENKLSFSPPVQPEGEYHSKDGWRPVLSGSSRNPSDEPEQDGYFNGNGAATSQEPNSAQAGSFEVEQEVPQPHEQFQPPQPLQQQIVAPNWAKETIQTIPPPQENGKLKPSPLIPPPVTATVKFPDSEEDHEDRHHHGRNKMARHPQQLHNFDRSKYMVRPGPPPIVMRRHPHATGPFQPPPPPQGPPPPPHARQPPPPPQRAPIMAQASQPNPQFSEHPLQRPQVAPLINRNFHMRPNPMRRFNFGGGPPQAQPRSGGNIKWPTEEENKDRSATQSETNTNSKRRRRRAVG